MDVYGRLVERRTIPFEPRGTSEVPFTLDLRRAVAMRNTLTVRLSAKGRPEETAKTSFIARPPDRPWWDYQIIMWQERTAEQYATLKKLGISAGAAVYGVNGETLDQLLVSADQAMYAVKSAHKRHRKLLDGPQPAASRPALEQPLDLHSDPLITTAIN